MKKVFLGYPTHLMVNTTCILSLFTAMDYARAKGYDIRFSPVIGESLITRARNTLVRKFLETDCDIFMCFDADIEILQYDTIVNLIEDLNTVDFTGALYPIKTEELRCSSILFTDKHEKLNYLNRALWLSTGCWAMNRCVIDKLIDAYPEHWYTSDHPEAGHKTYDLFGLMVVQRDEGVRKLLSEDWSMCQKYLEIGGEIWCNTKIILAHHGDYAYILPYVKEAPKAETPTVGFDLQ